MGLHRGPHWLSTNKCSSPLGGRAPRPVRKGLANGTCDSQQGGAKGGSRIFHPRRPSLQRETAGVHENDTSLHTYPTAEPRREHSCSPTTSHLLPRFFFSATPRRHHRKGNQMTVQGCESHRAKRISPSQNGSILASPRLAKGWGWGGGWEDRSCLGK